MTNLASSTTTTTHPEAASGETQCAQILAALKDGRKLTQLDALQEFGCLRLGARIWDLDRRGHSIRREMQLVGRKRVAVYWMEPAS